MKPSSPSKKALSLNPEAHRLHRFLFDKLEEKRRLEDLESFLNEITGLIQDPSSLRYFYFENATAMVNEKRYPQALTSFQKAMASNPQTSYSNHYNYGLALYYEGFFEEAIIQFEHAHKLDPLERLALNNIAHLHYCLGRVQKAREEFEHVLQNGLGTYLIHSNFLLVLYHLGEDEEVINQYKDLLKPSISSGMQILYNDQLEITQKILAKDDLDQEARKFNTKKLEAINFVLSFIKPLS